MFRRRRAVPESAPRAVAGPMATPAHRHDPAPIDGVEMPYVLRFSAAWAWRLLLVVAAVYVFLHVFSLLSTVLPPEPLSVALHGIRSPDPGLRGVAIEYLESVLPPGIWTRLWVLVEGGATPSDAGAHARSDPQPPATPR